ncbi:MAG: hypothetical protein IT208_08775 [Chthonomonadales bacterium]|nr:hypothetical protein [Chthonomonadales bacterium]
MAEGCPGVLRVSGTHGCSPPRVPGYRADGDAGLMLVGARYHDAQAGRFVTRDTLLGEHPYLYCEHEPVGSVDPSGGTAIATFFRDFLRTIASEPGKSAGGIAAGLGGGYIAGAGVIYGMENPLPPYDRGNLIVGVGGSLMTGGLGVGMMSVGLGGSLAGSAALGAALGGAALCTGGIALVGIGAIGAIYAGGHYFNWW